MGHAPRDRASVIFTRENSRFPPPYGRLHWTPAICTHSLENHRKMQFDKRRNAEQQLKAGKRHLDSVGRFLCYLTDKKRASIKMLISTPIHNRRAFHNYQAA